jgi:hypothetical protein
MFRPVISTLGAFFLFGDRLARQFSCSLESQLSQAYLYRLHIPPKSESHFERAGLNLGTGYALICALFWGLSTVAGRGVMVGMSLATRLQFAHRNRDSLA